MNNLAKLSRKKGVQELQQNQHNHRFGSFIFLVLFLMALLLNQSSVIFNINISLSDVFLLIIFIMMLLKKRINIPRIFFLFVIMLSFVVIFTSFFINPLRFGIQVDPVLVFSDYIKLLAVFLYFIVGYNLSSEGLITKVLKWFSFGSVCIGIIAIISSFIEIPSIQETFYYSESRFRGLMNDPNYFSIIQSSAMMYFFSNIDIKKKYKIFALLILTFSIFISGSKTGMILLILMYSYKLLSVFFSEKKNSKQLLSLLTVLIFVGLFMMIFYFLYDGILNRVDQTFPVFGRVEQLFTDFDGAVSSSGSVREMAWSNAINLIKLSPIFGIGLGTYSNLASSLFGSQTIAHNTYLQIAVEWGIVMSLVFICSIFYQLVKVSFQSYKDGKLVRNMLIPILVGSFSLSLNNARIFWLLLGALAYCVSLKEKTSLKRLKTNNKQS